MHEESVPSGVHAARRKHQHSNAKHNTRSGLAVSHVHKLHDDTERLAVRRALAPLIHRIVYHKRHLSDVTMPLRKEVVLVLVGRGFLTIPGSLNTNGKDGDPNVHRLDDVSVWELVPGRAAWKHDTGVQNREDVNFTLRDVLERSVVESAGLDWHVQLQMTTLSSGDVSHRISPEAVGRHTGCWKMCKQPLQQFRADDSWPSHPRMRYHLTVIGQTLGHESDGPEELKVQLRKMLKIPLERVVLLDNTTSVHKAL